MLVTLKGLRVNHPPFQPSLLHFYPIKPHYFCGIILMIIFCIVHVPQKQEPDSITPSEFAIYLLLYTTL